MRPQQNFVLVFLFVLLNNLAFGQSPRDNVNYCGSGHLEQELINADPTLDAFIKAEDQKSIQATQQALSSGSRATGQIMVIPVVFHILHDNGPENISDKRVKEAMLELNRDFDATHPHLDNVVTAFENVIGNAEMEFRLAKKDPNGNITSGIVRYLTTDTQTGNDAAKQGRGWPRENYLNIWVVNTIDIGGGGGTAGYSYRPAAAAGNPNGDGVVVEYNYVGGNDDSHTLAHEVGHWSNLKHTWGGTNDPILTTNCSDDDDVTDTPNTVGQLGGCNLTASTCGSLDNIQNIMNYANCPAMFTDGQITRMRAAMSSSTAARNNLWTTANLNATGVLDLSAADFSVNNRVVCSGQQVNFSDASTYGATNWDWTFQSGFPDVSTDQNPTVTYYQPGIYQVALTASDGSNTLSKSENSYILVSSATGLSLPYFENFESVSALPSSEWMINDVDGDLFGYGFRTDVGFSGTNSVKMNNFGNSAGRIDEFLSTSFDLSTLTDVTLTFQVAYAQGTVNVGNDNLRVYTSVDCGENWSLKWIKGGAGLATVTAQSSPFTPSGTSDWVIQTVTNITGNDLTENVRLKFEFVSAAGNNLYIDDINLDGNYVSEPVLQYPPNTSTERPDNVLLDWKALPGVTGYEYELSTDTNFGNVVLTGTTNYIDTKHINSDTEIPTSGLVHGQKYFWRVRALQTGGPSGWSEVWAFTVDPNGVGIEDVNGTISNLKLFPNPLTQESKIEFSLKEAGSVNLEVIDLFGRVVTTVASGNHGAGTYRYDIPSERLSSGIYLVRLTRGTEVQTLRAVLQ